MQHVDDRLFRRESGRMVAALTRIFGIHNLALAEDVVQDAFCRALEVWKLRGVPENPAAWLMTAAKNRALDVLRRERTARTYAPQLSRLLQTEWTLSPVVSEQFQPSAIKDDQLRMMFSCCQPSLPEDVQVALVLQLVCGFSVKELASAFLLSEAAMQKRLWRGKKALADSNELFDLEDGAFPERLTAVHRALYLLFNEGYHSASSDAAIRADLCREALRLGALLLDNGLTATPGSFALCALFCFNAARLPARLDESGELAALDRQDRSRWDRALINRGQRYLESAASGEEVSEYHIEAAMAWIHASAPSAQQTDWAKIVSLYDALLRLRNTPVVALNRAVALAQLEGPARGLEAIDAIADKERLQEYPFYFAALGELESRAGRMTSAREHFTAAAALARNPVERRFLETRVQECARRDITARASLA
ncbi:MAG: sigma-70 family RNA polymerase sigma factor [Candidatus Eremiobacteraeota bacterium]|nr:sigma-70 family RNA polymerase sigma factor [Candidatus Eremiobacteraeota bacterium]